MVGEKLTKLFLNEKDAQKLHKAHDIALCNVAKRMQEFLLLSQRK